MENKTVISMFDHLDQIYVEIRRTEEGWERWVSKSKKSWEKIEVFKTMDKALSYKQEVIDKNFRNLYNVIRMKR